MTNQPAIRKPRLRNLGKREWGIGLVASLVASATFATWFKINVVEARKKRFAEFYETYDDDKAFASMCKAGIFKGFEWSE